MPKVLVTDNAQCFMSHQFENFCRMNDIRHPTAPCLSPKSNGLAERAVQTFKMGISMQTVGSVDTKVVRFLFTYSITPHSITMHAPAEPFLGRQPRTHLDALVPDIGQRVRDRQDAQRVL